MRRVVTGVDGQGTSRVVADGAPPCVSRSEELHGMEVAYVWATDATPLVPNDGHDPTRADQEFFPATEGTRFTVITYPPGFGAGPPEVARADGHDMAVSFDRIAMHDTRTVDFAVVVAGSLVLVLGSGEEVTLRAGDVVVQNGAVHGWRNASDEPATLGFVIVGAHQATM